MSALAIIPPVSALDLAQLAVARLSVNTQRAYISAITQYLNPLNPQDGRTLDREHIGAWLAQRKSAGARPVTLNVALAALKLLARESWVRGLIDPATYNAIADLRAEPVHGQRLGQWTDEDGVERLLAACKDAREQALIGLMCGCGLRRSEVAGLTWSHYQERAGRMCIVDLIGKGGRVRTIAVPGWAAQLINDYKGEIENE